MGTEKGAVECDVGLGLKMQRTESFPCTKKMMMTTSHDQIQLPYYHHHHPLLSSSSSSSAGGFDGGGGGGPIYYTGNKQVACMGDVYDVVGAGAGAGAGTGSGVSSLPSSLHHHFNTDATTTAFKSSSPGIAAASVRVPFTGVQFQELERQTIIYNYMRASIPIPSELFFPITKSLLSSSSSDHGSAAAAPAPNKSNRLWDMGCTNNGTDPEPWRCRRTDGKKWRCSRDVAPDQKYCERHTHKNKPRSRKPVEVQQQQQQQSHHSTTTTSHGSSKTTTTRPPPPPNLIQNHNMKQQPQQFLTHVSPYHQTLLSATPYEQQQSRYGDWFMKGGTASVSSSNQQWQQQQQQLMQSTLGMKRDSMDCYKNVTNVYDQQQHDESINVNDQCSLFLGPKLVSLGGALNLGGQTERPRDFIDAWSIAERDGINEISHHNHKCSVSSHGKLPLSSLTLSMPGDNLTSEDEENDQMGIGMLESDRENAGGVVKSQSLLNWMNPGSWMSCGSTPGGPLAEALCLGMTSTTKGASNPESPHGCNSSNTNNTNSSHGKSPSGDDGSQGFNLM